MFGTGGGERVIAREVMRLEGQNRGGGKKIIGQALVLLYCTHCKMLKAKMHRNPKQGVIIKTNNLITQNLSMCQVVWLYANGQNTACISILCI